MRDAGFLASEEIAALQGDGSVALQSSTLTVSGGSASVFSGAISGSGALSKSGSGVMTLSGFNTFAGGVNLSGGALQVANNSALGSGTIAFTGGRLSSDSSSFRTITNPLAFAGSALEKLQSS